MALLIAPSRELAIQTSKVIEVFAGILEANGTKINLSYFIGGDKLEYDLERIEKRGANVVVATPGRLFDIISKSALNFKKLEMLVLDEADKLLDANNAVKMQTILE